jgi:hypothetical protein
MIADLLSRFARMAHCLRLDVTYTYKISGNSQPFIKSVSQTPRKPLLCQTFPRLSSLVVDF